MLVSLQTAVKGGHGFEIAVRMDNLRGGDVLFNSSELRFDFFAVAQ